MDLDRHFFMTFYLRLTGDTIVNSLPGFVSSHKGHSHHSSSKPRINYSMNLLKSSNFYTTNANTPDYISCDHQSTLFDILHKKFNGLGLEPALRSGRLSERLATWERR